jgi:competence protein ComEC
MTLSQVRFLWKEAPFIRLLPPFAIGIVLEQQFQINPTFGWCALILLVVAVITFNYLSLFSGFRFNWARGALIQLILLITGYVITQASEGSRERDFILHHFSPSSKILVTLQEPLQEKPNSFKAIVSIDKVLTSDSVTPVAGKMIVYFSKNENIIGLNYGSRLLISKPFEQIRDAGNPGGFDYKTYCYRNDIFFTVFLTSKDYRVLNETNSNPIQSAIFEVRRRVLNVIASFVPGKKESGFAKALLIGYTDDLDKELVQTYSNTGVVHIIAISGLHLGIIFTLLNFLVAPLKTTKVSRFVAALVIIVGLWSFSILAGAGPSVLRSAFMFSFMVVGRVFSRRSNVLNNLFGSAFILLCIHPFWFWDAGFQLSYSAVLSILLFFKPIYKWFYFPNKFVDFVWKLSAVTLSAQVLTVPICIYHFHQLPIYFILSNLLAVPWSSVILLAEILLCCISFMPSFAVIIGALLQWLIHGLNNYIEHVNALPFSTWAPLQISTAQLFTLFVFIATITVFLMNKKKSALIPALLMLFIFVGLRSSSLLHADHQKKIIVYNLRKTGGIDFISGRRAIFVGDNSNNLYLQPVRSNLRVLPVDSQDGLLQSNHLLMFDDKIILRANSSVTTPSRSIAVDMILMSNNTPIDLPAMIQRLHPGVVVADASNQLSKKKRWQKICESLNIPFHDVSEDGAFQYDLN